MEELTFKKIYLDKYYKYISLKLKPTTVLGIDRTFKKHILKHFNKNIYSITEEDYIKWQEYIKNLGFSNSFNRNVQIIIKKYFDYLENIYEIKNWPKILGKFNDYKKEQKKELNTWTIKEYKKFIKKVDDQVYKTLFNTLFFTGIRKSEALALKFKNIKNGYMYIEETITKDYYNGKKLLMKPKTENSIRKIPIDWKTKKEINKLKKYYLKQYNYFNEEMFIFGGIKSIPPTTLKRKKDNWCDLAKVKRIRIHDFRHSHATILYNKKIDIKSIQERLGHASVSTTIDIYIHLNKENEKRVLKTLNFIKIRL